MRVLSQITPLSRCEIEAYDTDTRISNRPPGYHLVIEHERPQLNRLPERRIRRCRRVFEGRMRSQHCNTSILNGVEARVRP
jgi:hypothetical protein